MFLAAAIRPGQPDPEDRFNGDPAGDWRASSRLDLHALWVRPPTDLGYRTHPLFSHPVLNRSVVAKFNMAPQDASRGLPRRLGATKLMLPLCAERGGMIAKSVIIASQSLESALGSELDYRAYDLAHDMMVLRRLAWLPSLDPFMVGEMGRHFQLSFAQCYLQITRAEQQAALTQGIAEIAPLLQWQLGLTAGPRALPDRRAVALLTDVAGPAGEEAAARMGLDMNRWSVMLLAWKGVVYYRRRLQMMDRQVRRVADEIGGAAPQGHASPEDLAMIDLSRGRVLRALTLARREAIDLADAFAQSAVALEERRSRARFIDYLQAAPAGMTALGERIRRLDEVCGGWRIGSADQLGPMDATRLRAFLADLERQLATDLLLRPCAAPRPGPRG